ncbi:tyrosine-type recombinase/integrase [Demequina globuliformis]|uniref:tyrosine-type recombinase/integrase n=1 Tax=Demequina globuliformis TaxID=676202 RepID=UPI0007820E45|nr:tyrosine-type recombinase/integrase [Demequina globuliformis]
MSKGNPRAKGTGSVHYDERRKRWIGTLEAGWTERGTRRRLTVSARTEREAKAKLKDKEREVLMSGAPEEGTRAGLTVKAWADRWIPRQERDLRPSAFNATRSQVVNWIVPTIGHKRLDRLSPADVRSVSTAMDSKGKATSSIRRAHGELIRMLKDAHADGHHVPDRARGVEFGRGGKAVAVSTRDAIPAAEMDALIATLATADDRARWLLALRAGVRPAEARGLRWSSVDLERGLIVLDWQLKPLPYKVARDRSSGFRVPRDYEAIRLHDSFHLVRPKTRSGWRVVPLDDELWAAMSRWREVAPTSDYDLVFPGKGGRALDDKIDRAAWWAKLDLAGLPRRALYTARHTAAVALKASGAADMDTAAIMGHSTIASTQAYLHGDVERGRVALARARSPRL